MLDEVGDAVFVECEDLDDARRKLGEAANAANALHLSLIMLDSLLSRETRRAACAELAERFEFDHAVEFVERVLYARPLGPEHDLPGARDLASAQRVCEFLDRLRSIQPAAAWVEAAWQRIPEDMFVDAPRRETFARFVQLGVVRELVKLVNAVDPESRSSHALPLSSRDDMQPVLAKWFSALAITAIPQG